MKEKQCKYREKVERENERENNKKIGAGSTERQWRRSSERVKRESGKAVDSERYNEKMRQTLQRVCGRVVRKSSERKKRGS